MIVIMRDAIMPDCCNTCVCSEGYGCGITGTVMTTKEMESRPDSCPLEEVEPCEDAVSRADVLESFADLYDTFEDCSKGIINELHRKFEDLRTLPSAQSDRCDTCRFVYYPKETNNDE